MGESLHYVLSAWEPRESARKGGKGIAAGQAQADAVAGGGNAGPQFTRIINAAPGGVLAEDLWFDCWKVITRQRMEGTQILTICHFWRLSRTIWRPWRMVVFRLNQPGQRELSLSLSVSVAACARLYASLAYGEAVTSESEFYVVLEADGGNNYVVRAARPVTGGLVAAGVTTGVSCWR